MTSSNVVRMLSSLLTRKSDSSSLQSSETKTCSASTYRASTESENSVGTYMREISVEEDVEQQLCLLKTVLIIYIQWILR